MSGQADLLKNSVSRFKVKKMKGNLSSENGLDSDMIRMIEDIMDKKPHKHSEQITGEIVEANAAKGNSSKTKIYLEDNNYGKY